ncbi:MAG TPA: aldehyde dehydrogenase family protein, partial [Pseudomonadota bacterium]|nr:aldehyde dehydrogenase family protein [Pseudomonadota bacterium]
ADARARGATVVCGGAPTGQGLFYRPTVLDHCTDDMAVVRDETFGPVLAVIRVEGPAEAIRRINRSRYGLGASIWTRDLQRAEQLAARLNVGVVDINNHAYTGAIPELPWSGTRETGFGIANSDLALGTFVRPRAVTIDRSTDPEPFWMPFDRSLFDLGHLLSEAQLFQLRSAWKLPFLLRQRLATIRAFFQY